MLGLADSLIESAALHRIRTPEETLALLEAHDLPGWAGVTRVANLTGLDLLGIPVVGVVRPNSRSLAVAQGKGTTLTAAKVSGLMEAIEMHAAERPALALRRASYNELCPTGAVLDPALLARPGSGYYHGTALLWAPARALQADRAALLPFDLVHLDWTLPVPESARFWPLSSNGLASGNSLLEATCHALYELVERDATSLFVRRGRAARDARRLALSSVDDPSCARLLEQCARADIAVAVWDTTSDVGIASCRCVLVERGPAPHWPGPVSGEGCHPRREVALARALTEAAQKRLTMITGARDDLPRDEYVRRAHRGFGGELAAEVLAGAGLRSFAELPHAAHTQLADDLRHTLAKLHEAGAGEQYLVPLHEHPSGLSVVRVIAPELEGIHELPNYVPGRRARALSEGKP